MDTWAGAIVFAVVVVTMILGVIVFIYAVAYDEALDVQNGPVQIDGCYTREACTVEYDDEDRQWVIAEN